MSDKIQVTSSEGIVPSSAHSSPFESATMSVPWHLHYNCPSKKDTTGWLHSFNECQDEGIRKGSQDVYGEINDYGWDEHEQLVSPNPIMAAVPFRRMEFSQSTHEGNENLRARSERINKTFSFGISDNSKLIQKRPSPARKPLLEINESPPEFIESNVNMLTTITPVSSRSSSSTSLASSISPLTPLTRYQKHLQEEEDAGKEGKSSSSTINLKVSYQQLLTKYFKAKKTIRRLKDQNKHDQKRLSLLELSQQEAVLAQSTNFKTKKAQEFYKENDSGSKSYYETVGLNEASQTKMQLGINTNEIDSVIVTNESDVTCESGNGNGKENIVNESKSGHVVDNTSNIKDELMKHMAAVISNQSLRPIVFNVSLESPPCKMTQVIKEISKSGRYCQRCGNKMNNK